MEDEFGDYILLARIAQGGMGVVYRAQQKSLGREVALKRILAGGLASEEEIRRFRTEAEAAAALSHPNIVSIHQVGEHGGQPFFSMDLVKGGNLGSKVARYPKDPRAAARLLAQVARAVHHAHQRGILHRDLKPSNILIDEKDEPHVTDFGLARRLGQDSSLTQSGAAMGTPSYMAPELFGDAKQATTAADIWSLGVILYLLLTSRLPFEAKAPFDTARLVLETEPRRPRAANGLVDRDLETICLRCLEKDPTLRYGSAELLADDLDRWLRHEPVHARRSSRLERTAKWARRRPAVAALVIVSLISVAAFLWQISLNRESLKRERDIAVQQQGEGLLREGEALAANNRFSEAKERLNQSRTIALRTKASPLPAEFALSEIYRVSPPPLLTLRGHVGKVTCVALSLDQRTIFSGGEDGTICAWSCPFGRLEVAWTAHPGGVTCLAMSPDGQICVSGGADQRLRVWDSRRQPPLLLNVSEGQQSRISSVCFSRDGSLLASASWGRTIRVWRVITGGHLEMTHELATDQDHISEICFGPESGCILAASGDRKMRMWHLNNPSDPSLALEAEGPQHAAASMDGRLVLSGSTGGLELRSSTNDLIIKAMVTESPVSAVAFFPHSGRALSGAGDGTICLWDIPSTSVDPLIVLSEHQDAVAGFAVFGDERVVVSAGHDGTVRVWDTNPTQELPSLRAFALDVSPAVFSPDGRMILSSARNKGEVDLWDYGTGTLLADFSGHSNLVLDVAFLPDGRRAASAGEDGTVRIWDLAAGRESLKCLANDAIGCIASTPDARLVAGGEHPRSKFGGTPLTCPGPELSTIHVWETETGRERARFAAHHGGILALAFATGSRSLWSGGSDGILTCWDTTVWRRLGSFAVNSNGITGVAFAPDASRCATASLDRQLEVWDLRSGKVMRSLGRLKGEFSCLALSGDGSLLLAGKSDADMKIWDVTSGRQLHSFYTWHQGGLSSIAFAPDMATVLSSGRDAIRFWDLRRGASYSRLAAAAEKAQATLQGDRHHGPSLLALAEWFAFRGIWRWAAQLFEEARVRGAPCASLPLAQCYWRLGQLDRARYEFEAAARRSEVGPEYSHLCLQAIADQMARTKPRFGVDSRPKALLSKRSASDRPAIVLQPGPLESKDIWTTSTYSYSPGANKPPRKSLLSLRRPFYSCEPVRGALGGGVDNHQLRVGGWGDWYHSLIEFDLSDQPVRACSAVLYLYCCKLDGGGTPMFLDRITEPWDWRRRGTGRDYERLWWADKPEALPWRTNPLPAPVAREWYLLDITDLYNAWQGGVLSNHGLQLRPLVNTNDNFNTFYSANYSDPSLRPKLIIKASE